MSSSDDPAKRWPRSGIGWLVILLVALGIVFEFGSIYADNTLPPPSHWGNFLSLISAVFFALGALSIMRRLSFERVSHFIMVVAALLFVFSKIIAWAGEYPFLHGVAVFGRHGFGYDFVQSHTHAVGLIMVLIGFIRSAVVANRARRDLEHQNRALRHEIMLRSEVEQALRTSETRYRELVDQTPDIVWRVGTDGVITYVSRSLEDVVGISPDTLVGKELSCVFSAEVAGQANAIIEQRLRGELGRSTHRFRFQYVLPDGEERVFESLSAPVFSPEGHISEIQGISRDITDEARAKESLAASEEKYRSFVENNPVPIARVNRAGKYVFVNQAFIEVVGLSRDDVLGKGAEIVRHALHRDDLARLVEDARQAMETRERRVTEVRLRDREGNWRWYSHLAYPWYEPDGRVGGVEAFARDVTEQKQAEEALRESEETARALINATDDFVGLVNREGTLLALNDPCAHWFGKRPAELTGANMRDLVDGGIDQERWKNMVEVLKTGKPLRFSDQQGERFYDHGFYPVGDEDGAFTRIAFYTRDVTDSLRRERERIRLAAAIEQAPDSVVVTCPAGLVEYVNPGFEITTGYARTEVTGATTRFLRSSEHDDAFYDGIDRTLAQGKVWSGRLVLRRSDGSLMESDTSISPVHNEAGAIINYVWLMHDISTEVSLERQLRQAQKMEAVGALAGGIAHDFNNILSLILGHGEMLLGLLPPNDALRFNLQQIMKAGNRGAELVKQILTFSRRVERRCEPCKVRTIVKEALRFLAASLPATVEIRQSIDAEDGAVMADPIQIYQVIMNLCTNAFQAMGNGGGILGISLDEVEIGRDFPVNAGSVKPGRYVRLTVTDTGCGIDTAAFARIFEPFFSTKKPSDGTGLGLSTVHGIVTGYGGGVRVHSQVGEGSIFEVFLPHLPGELCVEVMHPTPACAGSEHILFVDDDPDLARMAGMLLEQFGYTVETFTNSLAAFEAYSADPEAYDLVIVDQIMPHLTGVELAKRILARRPEMPVFLLTGYSDGITPEQARDMGIREFVMKPFSSRKLGGLIRETLDHVAARQN